MIRRTAFAVALALVAGSASAQYYDSRYDSGYGRDNGPRWDTARVVNVDPILAPGEPSYREQCWQEPVRYVSRDRGYDRGYGYEDRRYARHGGPGTATNTVLGGIVGAAIGRQFGDGDGRRAATVAGALLGGAIANDRSRQRYDDGYGYGRRYERETVRYEQRCQTVADGPREERVVGYRVAYDYNGHVYTTETPYHPGSSIRVRVDVIPET